MSASADFAVLSSWKEIANYVGKGVRTVQRWERDLGLPVRRPNGATQKSAVLLYRGDLDLWVTNRFSARAEQKHRRPAPPISGYNHTGLPETIRQARRLRAETRQLSSQIADSVERLKQRFALLQEEMSHVSDVSFASSASEPSAHAEDRTEPKRRRFQDGDMNS